MLKYLAPIILVILAIEAFILFTRDRDVEVNTSTESATEIVTEEDEQEEVEINKDMEVESLPTPRPVEEIVEKPAEDMEEEEIIEPIEVVRETAASTDLLSVGKIPVIARYTVSQSAAEEPARIPFKLFTRVPAGDLGKYEVCYTLLDDGVRVSETDCSVLTENYSLDTLIALTSLNLSPLTFDPSSSYMSVGTHKIEIVVALIPSNVSTRSKVTSDTSSDLGVLTENAVALGRTDQFTYVVTD